MKKESQQDFIEGLRAVFSRTAIIASLAQFTETESTRRLKEKFL